MLAAVQRRCPTACAYVESGVNTAQATWRATDDYIRKNRNVLLAYMGAWLLIIAYVSKWQNPACALLMTKGMTTGFFCGLGLGIATVKNIERFDPFPQKKATGSDADSATTSSSQFYGQIGPRPHLHTLGRAGYRALENLDAKVTRSVVLTIFVNTIFHAIPIFPTALGFTAGLVFGDEMSYVAATEGEHTHDFSEDLDKCEIKLGELEALLDKLEAALKECVIPKGLKKTQYAQRTNLMTNSFVEDNDDTIDRFNRGHEQFSMRINAVRNKSVDLRATYNKINNQTAAETLPMKTINSIDRSMRRLVKRIASETDTLLQIEDELTPWKDIWPPQWRVLRARLHSSSSPQRHSRSTDTHSTTSEGDFSDS